MKLRFRSLLELVAFRRRYTFQKLKPNTFPCTRYFVHAAREDTDEGPCELRSKDPGAKLQCAPNSLHFRQTVRKLLPYPPSELMQPVKR